MTRLLYELNNWIFYFLRWIQSHRLNDGCIFYGLSAIALRIEFGL